MILVRFFVSLEKVNILDQKQSYPFRARGCHNRCLHRLVGDIQLYSGGAYSYIQRCQV